MNHGTDDTRTAQTTRTAIPSVISIAGSDSSGGAGIQADIKTISAHRLYASTAITALTAQNTTGVFAVQEATPQMVAAQIDAVFSDIRPDAVKVGMVSSAAIITVIAERLKHWQATNIVVDPVMVATSGASLLATDAVEALRNTLLPLATVLTPNLPEAQVLTGRDIDVADSAAVEQAASRIAQLGCRAVLLKGGHASGQAEARDLLYHDGNYVWLNAPWVGTINTHGTGCTLSSAIACGLAAGLPLEQAVRSAKAYVSAALSTGLDLGQGTGPLNHLVAPLSECLLADRTPPDTGLHFNQE